MKIGILGAGLMAKRIGLLFADSNHEVVMWNHVAGEVLKDLAREARLWRVDIKEKGAMFRFTTNLSDLVGCDIVIESVIEDAEIKKHLLREVSAIEPSETIIVSNTSSLSLADLAVVVSDPRRFAGLHFFNPPQHIKFAEITKLETTATAALDAITTVVSQLGFSYVVVPDIPGFVVNNLLFSMINSAMLLLETSGLEPKIVDDAMKLGARHPMGPLELADFIGLDVSLNILSNLFARTADARFKPGKLLRELVANKQLGRKTRKGFYQYR
jgi:3-hydroxybutyryl-CoA dehydrogenase